MSNLLLESGLVDLGVYEWADLETAASYGNEGLLELLFNPTLGFDPDHQKGIRELTNNGTPEMFSESRTLLELAAASGHNKIVKLLLERKVDPNKAGRSE